MLGQPGADWLLAFKALGTSDARKSSGFLGNDLGLGCIGNGVIERQFELVD